MSGSATRALASRTRRFIPEESDSNRASAVQPHAGDDRLDPVIGVAGPVARVGEPFGHLVGDGAAAALGHLLREPGDAQALLADHLPLVRLELALDQPEQRALALAVAAQQADPLAPLDRPVDVIQQPGSAEGQADVSETQQRHE